MCHLHGFLFLPVIEFVIHESVEKAGLSHPAVAQDQELEQVIVVHFGMCKPNFALIYSSTQNLVRKKPISIRISLSTTEFAMSHFAAAWTTTLLLKSFFSLSRHTLLFLFQSSECTCDSRSNIACTSSSDTEKASDLF